MNVAIGSDHAGFDYKEAIKQQLASRGHAVHDFGTHNSEPVDYPQFIRPVAEAVYVLCFLTSTACAWLLGRSYARTGARLLLWSSICFAFLAYKEKPQWVWFAGLAVLAGIGGLLTLSVVHAQQFAWRA